MCKKKNCSYFLDACVCSLIGLLYLCLWNKGQVWTTFIKRFNLHAYVVKSSKTKDCRGCLLPPDCLLIADNFFCDVLDTRLITNEHLGESSKDCFNKSLMWFMFFFYMLPIINFPFFRRLPLNYLKMSLICSNIVFRMALTNPLHTPSRPDIFSIVPQDLNKDMLFSFFLRLH